MHRLIISTILCLLATTSFAADPGSTGARETVTTKSGMQYTALREGTGTTPAASDTVRVNYRGTLLKKR